MKHTNTYSHLTLEERRIILNGISHGSTKTAIAQTIGKDKSTVGKEIKAHRILVKKCSLPLECSAYRKCPFHRLCTLDCPEYTPFRCSRRDRSPVPAMAAQTAAGAGSTSLNITLNRLTLSTGKL